MHFSRCKKSIFLFLVSAALPVFFCFPVQAAATSVSSIPLILQVHIERPDVFWDCMFLTPNSDTAKPAMIKVEWNAGGISRQTKQATLTLDNKTSGQITILVEKDTLINFDVTVWGDKNIKLGSINMQVVNHGQTETVTIAPPARIEPVFTWGE